MGWGGAERSRVSRILDASTFVKHFVEIVLNEILASDIERRASSLQVSNIVFDKEVVLVGSSGMIKIGKKENKKIGEIKLEKETQALLWERVRVRRREGGLEIECSFSPAFSSGFKI